MTRSLPRYAAVVEDDPQLANQLCEILAGSGWQCEAFGLGHAFLSRQRRRAFDLAILDMRLPDLSGLELLRQLAGLPRHPSVAPTASIVVTGLLDEANLERAFALGAQDYLLKPFRSRELLARVQAVQSRRRPGLAPSDSADTDATASAAPARFGPFVLDRQTRSLSRSGVPIALTDKEFGIAELLFLRLGQTIPREEMRSAVWQTEALLESRTIDTHVSRVRRKLGLDPGADFQLTTVYGVGYRLYPTARQTGVSTQADIFRKNRYKIR
ncbi:MAG: response regulator transcription factor [Burkholderiaceae bacterium]